MIRQIQGAFEVVPLGDRDEAVAAEDVAHAQNRVERAESFAVPDDGVFRDAQLNQRLRHGGDFVVKPFGIVRS